MFWNGQLSALFYKTNSLMWFTLPTQKLQAPRTSRASLMKGSSRSNTNTAAQQALIAHWQGIVKSLGNFLNILKVNNVSIKFHLSSFIRIHLLNRFKSITHIFFAWSLKTWLKVYINAPCLCISLLQVPPFLVRKVFTQIFSFINVQLFNR